MSMKQKINQYLNTLSPLDRSHSIRVSIYARNFGKVLGFNDHELKILSNTAIMHDIGKSQISRKILEKKGKLNTLEFEQIKTHPAKSEEILLSIPGLKDYAYITRHHHERWDGTGYPDRLKEQDIPLYSRIISIVDVYDALTSKRPYREKVFTPKEALKILVDGMESQFDPEMLKIFIRNSNEILGLYHKCSQLKSVVNITKQQKII